MAVDAERVRDIWDAYRTVIVYGTLSILFCVYVVVAAQLILTSQTYLVKQVGNETIRIPVNESEVKQTPSGPVLKKNDASVEVTDGYMNRTCTHINGSDVTYSLSENGENVTVDQARVRDVDRAYSQCVVPVDGGVVTVPNRTGLYSVTYETARSGELHVEYVNVTGS